MKQFPVQSLIIVTLFYHLIATGNGHQEKKSSHPSTSPGITHSPASNWIDFSWSYIQQSGNGAPGHQKPTHCKRSNPTPKPSTCGCKAPRTTTTSTSTTTTTTATITNTTSPITATDYTIGDSSTTTTAFDDSISSEVTPTSTTKTTTPKSTTTTTPTSTTTTIPASNTTTTCTSNTTSAPSTSTTTTTPTSTTTTTPTSTTKSTTTTPTSNTTTSTTTSNTTTTTPTSNTTSATSTSTTTTTPTYTTTTTPTSDTTTTTPTSTTITTTSIVISCPKPDGLYPNVENCSTFYHCSHGTPFVKECPHGLVFNPVIGVCDYPDNVTSCKASNDTQSTYPTPPHSQCTSSSGSHSTSKCSNTYYICSNNVQYKMNCPANLVFNPKNKECDYPENVPSCKGANESFSAPTE